MKLKGSFRFLTSNEILFAFLGIIIGISPLIFYFSNPTATVDTPEGKFMLDYALFIYSPLRGFSQPSPGDPIGIMGGIMIMILAPIIYGIIGFLIGKFVIKKRIIG